MSSPDRLGECAGVENAPTAARSAGEHVAHAHAMATDVIVRLPGGADDAALIAASEEALGIFASVEAGCTRFDPNSPLMKANASPTRWHRVPNECFDAIAAAQSGYASTHGVFDPRILTDLVGIGYDRTLPFSAGPVSVARPAGTARRPLGPWRPRFRGASLEVLLGTHPIDLGGIGKGLAVRWASERLSQVAPDHLIEAGGDCYCAGLSADGEPWRIAVEDPEGTEQPVAVLELRDRACATSSIRIRRWRAGGRPVHHLLDATTGRPGGDGLLAVTVIGPDPAVAEVWSKALFLAGAAGIAGTAERRRLAAVWVTTGGDLGFSKAAHPVLLWQR